MTLPSVFLPYQQQLWRTIEANGLTVVEKSRRTGYSWALAAIAADHAARSPRAHGEDVMYMGYDEKMTREFIDYVAEWAKLMAVAASDVQEFVFSDPDHPEREINGFRVKFASGFEVKALPSVPRSLRGKQGFVILDEAAFMDDLKEVLKAALAHLMWGGRVIVVSTHNGETNEFNQLINDVRAGRRKGVVLRLTLNEAIEQGIYHRVAMKIGKPWTQEDEDAWAKDIRDYYADNAAEELDVIPNPSSGTWLPGILIDARSRPMIPVLRYTAPDDMKLWPEHVREAEIRHWLEENVKPILDALSPDERHALGQDFGRSRDLTVLWLLAIATSTARLTRLVIELRNVPFECQKQILWFVLDRLRFSKVRMDAGGNGAHLAEVTLQRYGARIEEIKFTEEWYRTEMPPLKAAFEDGMLTIPMDDPIHTDLRHVKLIRGIARVADRTRIDEKATRHGDAAIALALAHSASRQDPEEFGYEAAGAAELARRQERRWRDRPDDFEADDIPRREDTAFPALSGGWL
jgi:phage FluMu gp28-like protein